MTGVMTDFASTFTRWHIWWLMSAQDMRLRYRRSMIGPFWLSIAMAVQVVGIGLLFAQIFDQPLDTFLLYLGAGFLVWSLILAIFTDACTILVESEQHLRALPVPVPVLAARMISKNLLIFAHNALVIGGLMLFLGIAPTLALIAVVPGLLIITLFGFFLAIVLGPFCLRFRDVTQVIASAMGIAFFLTPVLWMREQGRVPAAVVDWNPLYHLLELVRAPLMGSFPTAANWMVGLGLVAAAGLLAVITLSMTRKRIYLWL